MAAQPDSNGYFYYFSTSATPTANIKRVRFDGTTDNLTTNCLPGLGTMGVLTEIGVDPLGQAVIWCGFVDNSLVLLCYKLLTFRCFCAIITA